MTLSAHEIANFIPQPSTHEHVLEHVLIIFNNMLYRILKDINAS